MRMNWKDRAAYAQQAREMAKMTPATMCMCGHDSDDHAAFQECERCECRAFRDLQPVVGLIETAGDLELR